MIPRMDDQRRRFEAQALPLDAAYNLARWLSRSPSSPRKRGPSACNRWRGALAIMRTP